MICLIPTSLCRKVVFLFVLLAVPGFARAQAPANDSYANSIEVFDSNSVTGSNAGATLEAGEPIPAGYTTTNYQATIWYVFNPVAEEWYEINTIGSANNTVLAVWTGSSLGGLALMQVVNDNQAGTVSRIRFEGLPGTSYYISVAAPNAATHGPVTLTVQAGGNQMINGGIYSTSISPGTVDVSTATATTTFTIEMSVTSTIAGGYVAVYAPSGQQVATSPFTAAVNRISGNNFDGTYAVTLTLPRYLVPGTYQLGFEVQNAASNPSKMDSYGWNQMSSLGGLTLTVLNSGAQDTYSQFIYSYGVPSASAAQTADFDTDGVSNLAEFAFATDPTAGTTGTFAMSGSTLTQTGLPHIFLTGTGTQKRLRVEFVERVADASQGLTYQVEFSDDLVHWAAAANAPQVMATSNGFQAVFVEDLIFGASKTYRFGHVRISYQLPP